MKYEYIHKVHYHETDKMGITHHSNYVKWMEQARIEFLDSIGWNYARLEQEGIYSPVIGIECQYKRATTFDDRVRIQVRVEEFKGVKLIIGYTMVKDATGEIVLTGRSSHCFTTPEGKPLILKRRCPALDQLLREYAGEPPVSMRAPAE